MIQDKQRWNEKYATYPMPSNTAKIVEKYIDLANKGTALDLACGTGRNTFFMATKGFTVDAVDISDVALSKIPEHKNIKKIETDLDTYSLRENKYDLIVNCNYLDRRLMSQMKDALKKDGILIFETFVTATGEHYHHPSNEDFLLKINELLHTFIGLDIIYYEEKDEINLRGERAKIASLVAKKS